MLVEIATILIGFAVLTWSADCFVAGAAATARLLGVSSLVIGITVVGFGTSAPEILISVFAAWEGQPGIAVGNALGSNIANIALIIGATALIYPMTIQSSIFRRELPLVAVVTLATLAVFSDGELLRWEGAALLAGLGAVMAWLLAQARAGDAIADALGAEATGELAATSSVWRPLAWLVLGLALLLASSRAIIWASVTVAQALGVSDLVIGLSIVALGTSLPELATCIASARKGQPDIAMGNIIGSNIFNLLAVLGLASTIAPLSADRVAITRDYPVMVALTVALFLLAWRGHAPGRLGRIAGLILLTSYVGYQLLLGLTELGGAATVAEAAP